MTRRDCVIIVGNAGDAHAAAVARTLRARGVRAEFLDFSNFPIRATLAWDPQRHTGGLDLGGVTVDLDTLRSVYWRTATRTVAAPQLRSDLRGFAADEARRSMEVMLRGLSCPVINSPEAVAAHRFKPLQSAQVGAVGISTPATLVTNDPAHLAKFYATHPGGVIVKPVGGGAYVRRLVAADLQRHASIRACPMQYQAWIPGEDVRVFVIGDAVYAARIVTRNPDHVDFRTDPEHVSVADVLAPEAEAMCRTIARTLGLRFTGIDLRRQSDGHYVFLEANPSPMFLRFARDTGHPLLAALVELLLAE